MMIHPECGKGDSMIHPGKVQDRIRPIYVPTNATPGSLNVTPIDQIRFTLGKQSIIHSECGKVQEFWVTVELIQRSAVCYPVTTQRDENGAAVAWKWSHV